MTITNLIGAFMYIPQQKGHTQSAAAAATAMVFLWNAFYGIGPANMGYAIGAEVPSSRMRIKKTMLSSTSAAIGSPSASLMRSHICTIPMPETSAYGLDLSGAASASSS
jgi:hypothetical protein